MFRVSRISNKKRIGLLRTVHGAVNTPFFLPIATKGAVKNISPEEIKDLGAEIILGNTYHLWLRPGHKMIERAGGLQKFMHWDGPVLTDSGGYQVFSLGEKIAKKKTKGLVEISERGVEFRDPFDGKKHFMSPEKSIEIQLAIGSDIIMVLDECPPYPCSKEYALASLERTTRWAKRCKKYFDSKISEKNKNSRTKKPLLFGIIQGSVFKELRQESARQLLNLNFDGYAIGGVAVGEPREKMKKVLEWVLPMLPENKPRYLMGLGKPEEIVFAVENGVDMFDCVIPTRNARHGSLFIWKKSKQRALLRNNFYETISITNKKFKNDFRSVDSGCSCYTCRHYTRSYLRHLFSVGEPFAGRLATIHNLKFYLDLMEILKT